MEPMSFTDATTAWTDLVDVATATETETNDASPVEGMLHLETITWAKSGTDFTGAGLIQRATLKTDRTGSPYAALTVRCADGGVIEARWWRCPLTAETCPAVGAVWRLTGQVDVYQGVQQLRVTSAQPAPEVAISQFARTVGRPLNDLLADLEALIEETGEELSPLVRAALSGDTYERFCEWPAAQVHHGAARYGLLAHSIRVARLAQHLAAGYGPNGLPHDGELVIAAALLHDIGKVWTLPRIAGGPLPQEANEVDHVTRGVLAIQRAADQLSPPVSEARLARLLHAALAHHGLREWGAPVEPQSVEAWLVHLADLAEARLWTWSADA